ncbi:MAG: hypothetical protein LC776_00890 [Acidobacteria bacterium]|nr:hypothetical protein [Acidobacteriota bacterium]
MGTSEPCRNLVVLRSNLSGNPRFRDLIAQIAKMVGGRRGRTGEMPFAKLVQG